MKEIQLNIDVKVYAENELAPTDHRLVEMAKEVSAAAYAPYSGFHVGAAALLADGTIVKGNNQENAAYPSGTCAERTAVFAANALHPHTAVVAIAIAAADKSGFLDRPISPCGSCRQVLIETEKRFGHDIRILLYGTKETYALGRAADLLPLCFDKDFLANE